ncbi:MAG TPA: hypothetical protein VJ785_09000 [Anaerolineales bacterium]|nr:hypothetical protein [Anaerolineales bacterium]
MQNSVDGSSKSLPDAILQTVAYSDIFDHPLTAPEIHRYLIGLEISIETLDRTLEEMNILVQTGEYFTLPGREEIVEVRRQREAHSRKLLPTALRYGRILGSMPFIRMAALTGSLAVLNVSKADDFDYMLVTVPRRLWTARAFALLFNRMVKQFGHTICPNLIVSKNALEWPLHDLYSARELCQMIPITGMDIYHQLIESNAWAMEFLPNAFTDSHNFGVEPVSIFQKLLELPLRGDLGNHFESWEMNRKIARFSKQNGFGDETVFNAEVCQGNFHHHRKWTREVFESKLSALRAVTQSPGTAIGA